jgi:single-strand DNA-binding protein
VPNYAHATIVGHACADAEVKDANGRRVANFTIAVNDPPRDGQEKPATFYRVAAWERLADIAARYIRKGDAVMIAGRLTMESYRTRDGQDRAAPRINASEIVLLGNRRDEAPQDRPQEDRRAPRPAPAAMDAEPDNLPF